MPAYKDKKRCTWYAKFNVTDATGKRKQVLKRGFATKHEALKYEAATQTATPATITYRQLSQRYFDYRDAKPATRSPQESALNTYATFADLTMGKITRPVVMEWYLNISWLSLNNNTKNWLLNIVKAVFKFGNDFYELPNPAAGLKRFKTEKKEMETWTPDEFNTFLDYVDNELCKVFFTFLYWTGCRKGEAQALQYTDFSPDGYVRIRQQWTDAGLSDLKTESSARTLLLPDAVQAVLSPLLARCDEAHPFVFGGASPIPKSTIRYHWERSRKLAPVKPIRMHDLRHSFATNMINGGANIVAVSKYLGHANVNVTLRVYTHLLEKSNAEMVAMIDNMMKNSINYVSQAAQSQ